MESGVRQAVGGGLVIVGVFLIFLVVFVEDGETLEECKERIPTDSHAIWCEQNKVSNARTEFFIIIVSSCLVVGGFVDLMRTLQLAEKEAEEMRQRDYELAEEMRQRGYEDRKRWVENADIVELLKELDKKIENLRSNYSTESEQILIGHQKVGEGTVFERDVPQYDTRTRDVPEHVVEKKIRDSSPSDIELEIIRRGTNVLDDLIGKYRSGENLEITKRILKKLPAGEVGKKFEEYEMLEDAENWYAFNKLFDDAKRLKKKMRIKVDQTVVHGDYVDDRDTIIKDSVVSKSNVGAGGDDKFARLEKLTEMKKEGLIDDNEFKQMKKEILGK